MYRRWKSCEARLISTGLGPGTSEQLPEAGSQQGQPAKASRHRTRSRGDSMDMLQLEEASNQASDSRTHAQSGAITAFALAQWEAKPVNAWASAYSERSNAAHRRRRDRAQLAAYSTRLRCTALVLACTTDGLVAATPLVLPGASWGVWGPDARLPEHGDRNADPWWSLPSLHRSDILTSAPISRSMPEAPAAVARLARYAAKMLLHRLAQIKYTTPREDKMLVFLNAHALASERRQPAPAQQAMQGGHDTPAIEGAISAAGRPQSMGAPHRMGSAREEAGDFCLWDEAPSPPRGMSAEVPPPAHNQGGGSLGSELPNRNDQSAHADVQGTARSVAATGAAPPATRSVTGASSNTPWSDSSGSDSEGSSASSDRARIMGTDEAIGACVGWQQLLWSQRGGRRRRRGQTGNHSSDSGSDSSASSSGRRRTSHRSKRNKQKVSRRHFKGGVPPLPHSPASLVGVAAHASPHTTRSASTSGAIPSTPPMPPVSQPLRYANSEVASRSRTGDPPSSPLVSASPVFRSMRAMRKSARSKTRSKASATAGPAMPASMQRVGGDANAAVAAAKSAAAAAGAPAGAASLPACAPAWAHLDASTAKQGPTAAQGSTTALTSPGEQQPPPPPQVTGAPPESDSNQGHSSRQQTDSDSTSSGQQGRTKQQSAPQPWVVHSYIRFEPSNEGGVYLPNNPGQGGACSQGALIPFPEGHPSVLAGMRCIMSFPEGSAGIVSPHTFGPGCSPVVPPPPALHAWDDTVPTVHAGYILPATQQANGQPQHAAQAASPERWFGRGVHWLPRHGGSRTACLASAFAVPGHGCREWDVVLGAQGRAVEVWGMPPSAQQHAEQMSAVLLDSPHLHSTSVTCVHACQSFHLKQGVQLHVPLPARTDNAEHPDSKTVHFTPVTAVSGDLLGQVHLWEVPNTSSIAVCDLGSGRVLSPLEATVAAAGHQRSRTHSGTGAERFKDMGDMAPWAAHGRQGGAAGHEQPVWARTAGQKPPLDAPLLPSLLAPGEEGRLAYRMQLGEERPDGQDVLPPPDPPCLPPASPPSDAARSRGSAAAGGTEPEAVVAVHIRRHVIAAGGSAGTVCVWQRQWRSSPQPRGTPCESMPLLLLHCPAAHSIVRMLYVWEGAAAPGHPVRIKVASGGGDGVVRLWLLKSPSPRTAHPACPLHFTVSAQELRGHGAPITALACDRDVLVSSARDGKVKAWSASRTVHLGRCLRTVSLGEGGGCSAVFGSARKRASTRKHSSRSDMLGSTTSVIQGGLGGVADPGYATSLLLQNGVLLIGTSTSRMHALALAPFDPLFGTAARQGAPPPPPSGQPLGGGGLASTPPGRVNRKSRKGPRVRRGGAAVGGGASPGAARRSARDLAAAVTAGRAVPVVSAASVSTMPAGTTEAAAAGSGGSPLTIASARRGGGRDKKKGGKKKKRR